MSLEEVLREVWRQALAEGRSRVEVGGAVYQVGATRTQGLRTVAFRFEGHSIEGIEQNPRTASRWAKLAQEGQRIMQFRVGPRYIANVSEGRLTRYPAWKAQQLPD